MAELTNTEKARLAALLLEELQDKGHVRRECAFYIINEEGGSTLYFVVWSDDEPDGEAETLDNLASRVSLGFGGIYETAELDPTPMGDELVFTAEARKRTEEFLKWVASNGTSRDYYGDLIAGAFIVAWSEKDEPDDVYAQIAFPVKNVHLDEAALNRQLDFAAAVINALNRKFDVILNGIELAEVIPAAQPKRMMAEYRKEIRGKDEPTIPPAIDALIEGLRAQVAALERWKRLANGPFLPDGMTVLNAEMGVLGWTDEDDNTLIILSGDFPDDDLFDQIGKIIRDEELDNYD
jgi:hypothetical protein